MMTGFNNKLLTSTASLALLLAGAVAVVPATAQAEGCGDGGAVGHITLHLEEDSGLAWADAMTISATLCADGTAVGGGRVALILDNNFVNADPVFELEQGTVMTFWYSPLAWFENAYPEEPTVIADLRPIGQFRRTVLTALDGDKAALEDWIFFLTSPYPANGAYDIDGDGDADLRYQVWWK